MMVLKCRRTFNFFSVLLLSNVSIDQCGCMSTDTNNLNRHEYVNSNLEKMNIITMSVNRFEDTGHLKEIARKKGDGSSKEGSIMESILPMLILPFLVSTALIPKMLFSIKFLLIKSAIIGKIAVLLMLISFFRSRSSQGGVYNHYPEDLAKEHYGYQGVEEPGAYINKKRRRRRREF